MLIHLLALAVISASPMDKIQQAIINYLDTHYSVENGNYLCNPGYISPNSLPADFDSVLVQSLGKDDPLGKTIVNLVFLRSNQTTKSLSIVAEIALMQDVLVARQPLSPGMQIGGVDIEKRPIRDSKRRPLTNTAEIEGKQAKVFIQPGNIIYEDLIENKPLVNTGDKVSIILERGGIKISARGIARQKGGKGDVIKVSNSDSRKLISAEVIDSLVVVCR